MQLLLRNNRIHINYTYRFILQLSMRVLKLTYGGVQKTQKSGPKSGNVYLRSIGHEIWSFWGGPLADLGGPKTDAKQLKKVAKVVKIYRKSTYLGGSPGSRGGGVQNRGYPPFSRPPTQRPPFLVILGTPFHALRYSEVLSLVRISKI